MSDIITMFSIRARHSRGELLWQRAHRAVVAGVHGGEHVETLGAADFAQDDAVGAHTQRVDDEIADGDRALASRFGGRVSSGSQCGC
jgi:hypothetical protein